MLSTRIKLLRTGLGPEVWGVNEYCSTKPFKIVYTSIGSIYSAETYIYYVYHNRVGEGTVPLAIVVYIDGIIKHKIPVKPIYVTLRNLNSVVSGKACAWRVLGMMPSLRKSATLAQTDTWRKDRRLRLHHAGISHIVNMINKFGSEDKHILCADGKVHMYITVYTSIYYVIHVHTKLYL